MEGTTSDVTRPRVESSKLLGMYLKMLATLEESQQTQINWALGFRALVAALCLVSFAAAYHAVVPVVGASFIAGWALIVPLRLAKWVRSMALYKQAAGMAARLAAIAAVAFVLSALENAGGSYMAIAGSALFAGLLLGVALLVLRASWRTARACNPSMRALTAHVRGAVFSQLEWFRLSLRGF